MPRGNGVTSRASRATPASSWGRCPSPRSIGSTGCRPRSRSSRRPAGGTPARPSARSPRSTTTSACSSPGSARGTARSATGRSRPRPASRSWPGSSTCPPVPAFSVLAPVVRGQKGEYKDLFADLGRAGYVRARVNGQVYNLTDNLSLDRQIKHNIEVVIDRLKAGAGVPDPAGRGRRAGPEAGRGHGHRRGRGPARPAALVALRLHLLRPELRPAQPAALQLQQPAGDVPGVRRPGRRGTTSTPTCWFPTRPSPSGTVPSPRWGRSRTWASGGGTSSRESRPTSRPTRTDRPGERCSRAPGATSMSDSRRSGSTAPATG